MKESHVSPSQVEKWLGCRRAWAYSRVRPRKQGPAAAFGDRAHKIGEDWLGKGVPPDPSTAEGACILAGLEYLPLPFTTAPEWEFTFWSDGTSYELAPRSGTVKYTGKVDFPYGYVPGQVVIIGDHKTTGDIYAEHVKTPDKLESDPQRVIYSFAGGHHWQVEHVVAHWQYYQRKPARARPPIVYSEPLVQIRRRFRDLHERSGVPIRDARDALRRGAVQPADFPRSLDYCHRFGRCEYMNECYIGLDQTSIATASIARVLDSKGPSTMTTPANIVGVLQENAQAPGQAPAAAAPPVPDQVRAMIRNPAMRPPGVDPRALIAHYGLPESELDADVQAQPAPAPAVAPQPVPIPQPQQPAAQAPAPAPAEPPKKRGRPRKTKTDEASVPASEDERRFALALACSSGGISPVAFRDYLRALGMEALG